MPQDARLDPLLNSAKPAFERADEIIRRGQIAEGLRGILAVLNSNRSLQDILDYIVGEARRLLDADAAAIYRMEADEILSIQSAQGLSADYIAGSNIPLGRLATGRAVQNRQPVAYSDTQALLSDPATQASLDQTRAVQMLVAYFRSVLSVPLVIKGEAVGALTLYYAHPRDFQQEEIHLAVAFCDQSALAIENARLREQAREEAITAERSRLARDLHDSVTQMLFSASLIAEVLPAVLNRSPEEGQQALDELRQLTRGALAEMRSMLLELRPDQLNKTGLEVLIRQLAETTSGRTRTPVTAAVTGTFDLPAGVRLGLYRIAQESLNNISKHSGATQIEICLARCPLPEDRRAVELVIRDNGSGFQPETVTADHLGLMIMRERAESIGAKIEINSQPELGTEVRVLWVEQKEITIRNEE